MSVLSDGSGTEILIDEEGNPRAIRFFGREVELERVPVAIRRENDEVQLADASVAEGIAVVRRDDNVFVFRLDDIPNREVVGGAEFRLAFDPSLPGKPFPDPDPPVTYRCVNGDSIVQRKSDPNRTCPIDFTALTRV